ncbi:hypothetical protein ASC66_01185 [Leifsonia sp. Root4]|uniref:hypothetical protein n=1 Tax=Leifsonia sp. Root4 TaxID=1736525 RepID=UPI0007019DBD|nr:hypothetical protein [Leifsonia sp. Root4]KQW07642.1 hypothetical protein ASC66_01185 [Leifsonia sp. Root4]
MGDVEAREQAWQLFAQRYHGDASRTDFYAGYDAAEAELAEKRRRQAFEALGAIEDLLESQTEHDRAVAEVAWDACVNAIERYEINTAAARAGNPYRANPEPSTPSKEAG